MENNEIIPNVSCVFRELIKISSTNPRLNTYNQTEQFRSNNNYLPSNTYQSYKANDQVSFPSNLVENDRQKRHQALMNRLKNSAQQNMQLLGVQQSPIQRQNTLYDSRRNQTQTPAFNQYSNEFNSYSSNEQRNEPKKWAPPQIKYRHIADVQQKSTISIENENKSKKTIESTLPEHLLNQMKLKNEFYQSSNAIQGQNKQNNFERSGNQNNQSRSLHDQEDYYNQDQNDEENMNKFSILSQKPSKYNQNLQSYYDICRRPVKPSVLGKKTTANEEKTTNNQKFIRRQTSKVEGINLQKAMRILSLDD